MVDVPLSFVSFLGGRPVAGVIFLGGAGESIGAQWLRREALHGLNGPKAFPGGA